MRVLVTGGAGRLGYAATLKLLEKGHTVEVFDLPAVEWSHIEALNVKTHRGDITDPQSLEQPCRDADAVVHLAAMLPPRSEVNQSLTLKVNVEGTRNILDNVHPGTAIVLASSISTYGVTSHKEPPITEEHPQTVHNSYSMSKIMAEQAVKDSVNPHVILRIAPITVTDIVELPDVIPYRCDQRVEFIHVDDAAEAITQSIHHTEDRKAYNIAGGDSWQMTGAEYIRRFYAALGITVDPEWSQTYTALDWYDTRRSLSLRYQNTSFTELERRLKTLAEELGLR